MYILHITCYTFSQYYFLSVKFKVADLMPDEVENCLILSAGLGSGVYSASNINKYQEHTNNNVSRE
jgi:hypothetical protein